MYKQAVLTGRYKFRIHADGKCARVGNRGRKDQDISGPKQAPSLLNLLKTEYPDGYKVLTTEDEVPASRDDEDLVAASKRIIAHEERVKVEQPSRGIPRIPNQVALDAYRCCSLHCTWFPFTCCARNCLDTTEDMEVNELRTEESLRS